MEFLDGVPIGDISTVAIIVAMGFFVLSGRLRPDKHVQEIRKDADDKVTVARSETEKWREAYHKSEDARASLQQAVTSLMEVGRTTDAVLRAIGKEVGSREH